MRFYEKVSPHKRPLWWINLLGISIFLATATYGLATHWEEKGELWGGVPDELIPLYAVLLILAPLGYLLVTHLLLFKVDAKSTHTIGNLGFKVFPWLYLAILIPSALWMPLTFSMIDNPSEGLWLLIRLILWLVALVSLLLLVIVLKMKAGNRDNSYNIAVMGAALLCTQTVLMDAVIWVADFTY